MASPELEIDAGILEVALGAAFAIDLVVGVGAAVDLSAGFYVSFAAGDYIDLSAVTKEIVTTKLDGLLAKALPIGVGAEVDLSTQIEVQLGLRLRSHVSIGAGVNLLGLDLLDAGADISIWADLAAYTILIAETANCALDVQNLFALRAGIAVDVGIELLDLLDLSIAPEVNVELANTSRDKLCLNGRGSVGDFLLPKGSEDKPSEDGSESPAAPTTSVPANATITGADGLVTSTISNTKTYTITSCHVSVPNCPASETQVIVTSTVESTVTVCPAEPTDTPIETPTAAPTTSTKPHKPVHTITETLTTVVPCEPTSSTYTPPPTTKPPPAPTVTITGSTTVCPPEETGDVPPPTGDVPAPTGGVPTETAPPTEGVPSLTVTRPTPTPGAPEETEPVHTPEPSVPVTEPVPTPGEPVPTDGTPIPVPTGPAPNSTFTTVTPPATTWTPPTLIPTSTPEPTQPPVGGAGALKVGFAMVVPVVAALLL